jgi:phosphoserine phosphatase
MNFWLIDMSESKPIAVFDMDGVLVHQRSSWRIVHDALGTSNEHSFQAYMRGDIDDEEFMLRDIDLWLKKGIRTISQVADILKKAVPVKGWEECFGDLKREGVELAILSGGIDILAEELGRKGDIDHIFANGIGSGSKGELTGRGILNVPLRNKGSVLRSFLKNRPEFGPVFAIGDSEVDITMFQVADLSIAFRPENERVSENADVVIDDPDLSRVSSLIIDHLKGSPESR